MRRNEGGHLYAQEDCNIFILAEYNDDDDDDEDDADIGNCYKEMILTSHLFYCNRTIVGRIRYFFV